MITHENLVGAVYQSVGAWSCPNGEGNCDCDCRECAEKLIKEYEDAIRADGKRECGEELLTIINEKPCGTEKKNLWLISQIKHFCFGVPRICDEIEGETE